MHLSLSSDWPPHLTLVVLNRFPEDHYGISAALPLLHTFGRPIRFVVGVGNPPSVSNMRSTKKDADSLILTVE